MKYFYRETILFDETVITQKSEYSWSNESPTAKELNISILLQEEFLSIKDENDVHYIIRISDISNIKTYQKDDVEKDEKEPESVGYNSANSNEDDIPF